MLFIPSLQSAPIGTSSSASLTPPNTSPLRSACSPLSLFLPYTTNIDSYYQQRALKLLKEWWGKVKPLADWKHPMTTAKNCFHIHIFGCKNLK
jgi:hypothetical protein